MPYFGKTQTEVDDYGPRSVIVCYPGEQRQIAVALHDGMETYILLHNGELHYAHGKIALCHVVERLPETTGTGFAQSEEAIWEAMGKEFNDEEYIE